MTESETPQYLIRKLWILLQMTQELFLTVEENTFRLKTSVSYQQFLILMNIESSLTPMTPVELARQLLRKPNTVSNIIDRMEKQGLVKRIRGRKDRRLVYLKVTPLGKEKLSEASGAAMTLVRDILKDFSEKDMQLFIRLTEKLISKNAQLAKLPENPSNQVDDILQRVSPVFGRSVNL
jgi:DNA-binding MarR family transcriptional regulator